MLHIPTPNSTIQLDDKTSIVCEFGKRIIIQTEDKPKPQNKKPRPSWTAIGNGMETRHFKSYPYEETLLKLTANEAKMYRLILKNYDYTTGVSVVDLSSCTPSEKSELSRGYKGLRQRDLVKRTKQKTYLINPTAKIHLNLFDELLAVWEATT